MEAFGYAVYTLWGILGILAAAYCIGWFTEKTGL